MSIVRIVQDRIGHLVHELAKYGVVGGGALLLNFVLFRMYIAVDSDDVLHASVIATVISTIVAYFGNRYWTYRDRESTGRWREITLFFACNGIAMVIQVCCLAVTHYMIGWHSSLGDIFGNYVLGTTMGMGFRFWAYRTLIFPETAPALIG